jgi:hypothetical protein
MATQQLKCPICKTGNLRPVPKPVPNQSNTRYYLCRGCPERYRAEYELDPNSDTRLLLFAVRENPEFKKALATAKSGADFTELLAASVEKLAELKKQGIQMYLESERYYVGSEDVDAG